MLLKKIDLLILTILCGFALFLRWYKLGDLLGFQYDQGRDALIIDNLITRGKFFLVGPMTGLDGIFLGPLLYYLLAPFYFLGRGNPVIPAAFMGASHLIVIVLLYKLGSTVNRTTAVIAAILYTFSLPIISLNRWLSNPPPVMIGGTVLLYSLYQIYLGKRKYWLLTAISLSMSLQFEVASAFFFIPAVVLVYFWPKIPKPTPQMLATCLAIFVFFLTPQILFDFRHNHVMTKSIIREFVSQKSFTAPSVASLVDRLSLYRQAFGGKLFGYNEKLIQLATPILVLFGLMVTKTWLSPLTKLILIIILSQLLPLLLYQGNHGNVYEYHFSANFPLFFLLVAIWIGKNTSRLTGKIAGAVLIVLFSRENYLITRDYFTIKSDDPASITLRNQKQAINWIYQDAAGKPFNVDIYVPPVIPYAYDYLFAWIGKNYPESPQTSRVLRLYTLHEADPPHPERRQTWLNRQVDIGQIEKTVRFDGITVDRRNRLTPIEDRN